MFSYPKEQVWKIYEQLPEELKEAIFSQETAENILTVCKTNGIKDSETVSQIARLTGYVLLGLLPINEFEESLKQELKLKEAVAKRITFGIHRLVFFPVRKSLNALYEIELNLPKVVSEKEKNLKRGPKKKDLYREPIE
jgi:hypothetical protein